MEILLKKKNKVIFFQREPSGIGTARNDYTKKEYKLNAKLD